MPPRKATVKAGPGPSPEAAPIETPFTRMRSLAIRKKPAGIDADGAPPPASKPTTVKLRKRQPRTADEPAAKRTLKSAPRKRPVTTAAVAAAALPASAPSTFLQVGFDLGGKDATGLWLGSSEPADCSSMGAMQEWTIERFEEHGKEEVAYQGGRRYASR